MSCESRFTREKSPLLLHGVNAGVGYAGRLGFEGDGNYVAYNIARAGYVEANGVGILAGNGNGVSVDGSAGGILEAAAEVIDKDVVQIVVGRPHFTLEGSVGGLYAQYIALINANKLFALRNAGAVFYLGGRVEILCAHIGTASFFVAGAQKQEGRNCNRA